MVALAECHLQDRAASRMLRLEREKQKPESLQELKREMIHEFVPTNEKASARVQLMDIKLKDSSDLNEHEAVFEDLVSLCGTPTNEAYIYFFNSLPKTYKGKFAERFPDSQPLHRTGRPSIQVAYYYARTLELSMKLSGESQRSSHEENKRHEQKKNKRGSKNGESKDSRPAWKNDNTVTWGPAKKGENTLYRKHDRCFTCGEKGWSDPNHPCRKHGKGSDNANTKNE